MEMPGEVPFKRAKPNWIDIVVLAVIIGSFMFGIMFFSPEGG